MAYSQSMHQKQAANQELRLSQRMMMSPHMQQALQFLVLPVMEMSQLIDQEMEQNPLLELEEEGVDDWPEIKEHWNLERKKGEFREALLPSIPSLRDILYAQFKELTERESDRILGLFIIDNLDEGGFLVSSLEEMALLCSEKPERMQRVLTLIQQMEPAGVGARTIQEALLLQLERKNLQRSLAYEIVLNHYDDLLHNRIVKIKNEMGIGLEEIESSIQHHIATLDLHPGLSDVNTGLHNIIPDVMVHCDEEVFRVEVTDPFTHRLHLNDRYMQLFNDPELPLETKNFIKEKLRSVQWLMKNIEHRSSTLQRITEELIQWNLRYFLFANGTLNPLTMKKMAERLDLHESTITRAVANKYLSCDRGTIALKSFFTNGFKTAQGEHISSATIRDKLKSLIGEEDPQTPLSDEQLSRLLKQQGISCARRTVAKYRGLLKIGCTSQRRRF